MKSYATASVCMHRLYTYRHVGIHIDNGLRYLLVPVPSIGSDVRSQCSVVTKGL